MINENEKESLEFRPIVDKDDNGRTYTKSIYYMKESVRISIKTLIELGNCSKSAREVYIAIINEMDKNKYEVTVSRSTLKEVTKLSDASISLAVKELKTKGMVIVDKDTYHIPINQCVKGNVNTIIQKEKELQEESAMLEQEKEARKRITEFSLKLRNKC